MTFVLALVAVLSLGLEVKIMSLEMGLFALMNDMQ